MDNKQKRILFITNLHMWSMAANKGGRAFITTVESYIKEGWRVAIVSTGGGIPEHVRDNAICYEKSFPIIDEYCNSSNKLIRFLFKRVKSWVCYKFYLKKSKVLQNSGFLIGAIVYAYEIEGVKAAKTLSERYGHPLVTRFQGTIIAPIENNILNRLKYYPHFEALSTLADLIIMTNDGTQGLKTLKRLGNNSPVRFWMNGVSVPPLITKERRAEAREKCGFKNEFVFLTVSRLVGWKRVERAIDAFAKVKGEISNATLHIIGDGAAKGMLVEETKKQGVEEHVVFHGAIEQTRVFDFMVASDVFLSLYDLSNVGNPLLEAMSCGKPIITLDNGDTAMFIYNMENGIILQLDDVDKVHIYMKMLYQDKGLSLKLGAGAREYAEKNFWSWEDRMKKEIFEVENLLQNNEAHN